jgi:hypothetical protein
MWRKVRRANISPELRAQFEVFGEDVLAHGVGADEETAEEVLVEECARLVFQSVAIKVIEEALETQALSERKSFRCRR